MSLFLPYFNIESQDKIAEKLHKATVLFFQKNCRQESGIHIESQDKILPKN